MSRTQHDDCEVKVFAVLPRRPDISEQQFHDHWRHPHGSMGITIPVSVHYVQSHRIGTPLLSQNQATYDGIVEVWATNLTTASAMPTDPTYVNLLREDEPRFIDMARMQFVFTRQVVYRNLITASGKETDRYWSEAGRPVSIKLLQFFPAGHPAIGKAPADADLQKLGAFLQGVCRPMEEIHGDNPPFGEVREYWWPTLSSFESKAASAPRELLEPAGTISLLVQAERYK